MIAITPIRDKILEVVDEKNGAFWGDFYAALHPLYSAEGIRAALQSLVQDKVLRMKEDSHEHDWEYRRSLQNKDSPATR